MIISKVCEIKAESVTIFAFFDSLVLGKSLCFV